MVSSILELSPSSLEKQNIRIIPQRFSVTIEFSPVLLTLEALETLALLRLHGASHAFIRGESVPGALACRLFFGGIS